jgi:2-dehydro-3-deoxyphosphogluconate aldolase/(4S)-4-hydroxy-2-oxoglutarate aldolase
MKRQSRQQVGELIAKYKFMPLFNHDDINISKKVIEAAYAGGVRVFEFTDRSEHAFTLFKELVPFMEKNTPDLLIGAGTIMTKNSAEAYYHAGAQFIVSPVIPHEVAEYCEREDIFWCPGASTLNEIVNAHNMGADLVKIFPANFLGGPKFLEAIKGPCPWIKIMATGGVNGSEEVLKAWFDAGATCVGMGTQLFTKEILESHDYTKLTETAKKIVSIIDTL